MKNMIRNYGVLSVAILTALPATAMMHHGNQVRFSFEQATNTAYTHPFYTATVIGAAAAAGFYFYNPNKAKEWARKATGSGVANAIVAGAALGTGAGLVSNYMESKQLPFSTMIPLIAGTTLYESTKKFMDQNQVPCQPELMYLSAISTWLNRIGFNRKYKNN